MSDLVSAVTYGAMLARNSSEDSVGGSLRTTTFSPPACKGPRPSLGIAHSYTPSTSRINHMSRDVKWRRNTIARRSGMAGDGASVEPRAGSEERLARLQKLKSRMTESSRANRQVVAAEQAKQRQASQRRGVGSARKLAKAERALDERDMEERGEDVERHRALRYTIEENEAWEEKLSEKERRRDKGAIDFQDLAERSYLRQISQLKPDHAAYQEQKKEEESRDERTDIRGSASTAVAGRLDSSSGALTVASETTDAPLAVKQYGQHRPDEDAVDRMVKHLNQEYVGCRRNADCAGRIRSAGAAGGVLMILMRISPTSTTRTSTLTRRSSVYVALRKTVTHAAVLRRVYQRDPGELCVRMCSPR